MSNWNKTNEFMDDHELEIRKSYVLGYLNATGYGDDKYYKDGIKTLKAAAKRGHDESIDFLSFIQGLGVTF